MNKGVSRLIWNKIGGAALLASVLLFAGPNAAASTARPAQYDTHDKLALALALQKQCGGLPLWEEIFLSNAVAHTWYSEPGDNRSRNLVIGSNRSKHTEKAKALGCEGGLPIRQEVHGIVAIEALSLLTAADIMARLPANDPSHRFATAYEAELSAALVNLFMSEYASEADQLRKAVDANVKRMASDNPSGGLIIESIDRLFASAALQNAANMGKIEIRLPHASEIDSSFRAVELETGKVWRAAGLPRVRDEGGVHKRERPYGLLLFGPDNNLAHIVIDRVKPQSLPKGFVAAMSGGYRVGEFAHGEAMTSGCPWQACYVYSKADTDRLLATDVSWFDVYLANPDGKNEYFVNAAQHELQALRNRL